VKFARPQLFSFSRRSKSRSAGYDLDALAKAGHRLGELMKDSPRFADIKSTVEGRLSGKFRSDSIRIAPPRSV
jgi:HAE1 family hydrophobic/amphiphilic exporter-1